MRLRLDVVVVLSLLLLTSCNSHSDISALQRAFASFQYVGDTLPSDGGPGIGQHGLVAVPFPNHLIVGRQYVFHRRRQNENAWTDIERALRANGATIIEAPIGNQGLSYTYIGGPWFVIRFRLGQINGVIQNYPARDLNKMSGDLQSEDFVLEIS
jgi:hypothetical protein